MMADQSALAAPFHRIARPINVALIFVGFSVVFFGIGVFASFGPIHPVSIGTVGFFLVILIATLPIDDLLRGRRHCYARNESPWTFVAFATTAIALYLFYFLAFGIPVFQENVETARIVGVKEGMGAFKVVTTVGLFGTVWAILLLQSTKRLATPWLFVGATSIAFLLTGFRSLAADLILLAGGTLLLVGGQRLWRGRGALKTGLVTAAAASTAIMVAAAMTALRYGSDRASSFASLWNRLFLLNADTNIRFFYRERQEGTTLLFGASYLWDLRGIRPGPDTSFARWATERMNPSSQGDFVMTPTIVGEAMANFGLWSIAPYGLFMASAIFIQCFFISRFRTITPSRLALAITAQYLLVRVVPAHGLGSYLAVHLLPLVMLFFVVELVHSILPLRATNIHSRGAVSDA